MKLLWREDIFIPSLQIREWMITDLSQVIELGGGLQSQYFLVPGLLLLYYIILLPQKSL